VPSLAEAHVPFMSPPSLLPNVAPLAKPAPKRWNIDPLHSTVGFSVRHLMVANVHGVFEQLAGSICYDPARPEVTRAEVTIEAASIHTRDPRRDAHLRDPDFLDVARYPELTFRSSTARLTRGGNLQLLGELTLRGVTRPITLQVSEIAALQRDFRGQRRIGASATARLRRSDFGITYNLLLEAGHLAISDEVLLSLDVSLVQTSDRS
jgi:polyisoprenoid-binding protein YceI